MNKQTNQTFISQFVTGFEFKKKKNNEIFISNVKVIVYIHSKKKKKVIIYIRMFLSK